MSTGIRTWLEHLLMQIVKPKVGSIEVMWIIRMDATLIDILRGGIGRAAISEYVAQG